MKLTVREGTTAKLESIGVRDNSAATARTYPDMPVGSGGGWWRKSAFSKGEGPGHINIGLGRGKALEIFNDALVDHERLR